jgi:hypothetical protein
MKLRVLSLLLVVGVLATAAGSMRHSTGIGG